MPGIRISSNSTADMSVNTFACRAATYSARIAGGLEAMDRGSGISNDSTSRRF